jgi:NADPH:quinone reductase-like Zn-dependent oxidoreductase
LNTRKEDGRAAHQTVEIVSYALAQNSVGRRVFNSSYGGDGIDVILDYLWGQRAERIIIAAAKAGKDALPIRFVHIGSVSAPNITLPSAALRSSAITLMGSGIGSIPMDSIVKSIGELMLATISGGFEIVTKTFPLSEIEHIWPVANSMPRTVFQTP